MLGIVFDVPNMHQIVYMYVYKLQPAHIVDAHYSGCGMEKLMRKPSLSQGLF